MSSTRDWLALLIYISPKTHSSISPIWHPILFFCNWRDTSSPSFPRWTAKTHWGSFRQYLILIHQGCRGHWNEKNFFRKKYFLGTTYVMETPVCFGLTPLTSWINMHMGATMIMRLPMGKSLKSYSSCTIQYGTQYNIITQSRSVTETRSTWVMFHHP